MKRTQQGFTLIELVIVIVILGVLSAFALPRFANLGEEARVATLDGAIGSVRAAAAIARSQVLAQDLVLTGDDAVTEIDMDGVTVTISEQGFPTADEDGIGVAAQIADDFDITGGVISILTGENARENCNFTYSATTGQVSGRTIGGC